MFRGLIANPPDLTPFAGTKFSIKILNHYFSQDPESPIIAFLKSTGEAYRVIEGYYYVTSEAKSVVKAFPLPSLIKVSRATLFTEIVRFFYETDVSKELAARATSQFLESLRETFFPQYRLPVIEDFFVSWSSINLTEDGIKELFAQIAS